MRLEQTGEKMWRLSVLRANSRVFEIESPYLFNRPQAPAFGRGTHKKMLDSKNQRQSEVRLTICGTFRIEPGLNRGARADTAAPGAHAVTRKPSGSLKRKARPRESTLQPPEAHSLPPNDAKRRHGRKPFMVRPPPRVPRRDTIVWICHRSGRALAAVAAP